MRRDHKLNYDEWPNLSQIEESPLHRDDRNRFPDGDLVGPLPRPAPSKTPQLAITLGVLLLLGALSLRAVAAPEPACVDLQREVERLRAELIGVRALCGSRCRPAR